MFSAKLTIILYILVFFELGAVLIVSPWYSYWSDNLFLTYLVQRFQAPSLIGIMNSHAVRWAVTGLGILNILLGIWEAFHFKQLLRLLTNNHAASTEEAMVVPDQRPQSH